MALQGYHTSGNNLPMLIQIPVTKPEHDLWKSFCVGECGQEPLLELWDVVDLEDCHSLSSTSLSVLLKLYAPTTLLGGRCATPHLKRSNISQISIFSHKHSPEDEFLESEFPSELPSLL